MGFLSGIASAIGGGLSKVGGFVSSAIGGLLGGSSKKSSNESNYSGGDSYSNNSSTSNNSIQTLYKPDDVKIAQINKEKELELAKLQKDLELAIEEAKSEGMKMAVEAIIVLQKHLNDIATDSFKIIEGASVEIVKEIESLYQEIGDKIRRDDIEYYEKKLPVMVEQMSKIDKESNLYEMFQKRIDEDIASHINKTSMLLVNMQERSAKLIDSHIKSKDKMIENSAKITERLVNKYSMREILTVSETSAQGKLENKKNLEIE